MVFRSKVPLMGRRCKIAAGSAGFWDRIAPFVCAVPFAAGCEGRTGAFKAEMADEAVGLEAEELAG